MRFAHLFDVTFAARRRLEACVAAALALGGGAGCGGLLADDAKPPPAPVVVPLPLPGPSLAVTDDRTCTVSSAGRVACWGASDGRKLGVDCSDPCGERPDGGPAICCTHPTEVPGLVDVRQVALGRIHSCALHGDGAVSCWYADGIDPAFSSTPVRVPGLANVRQIVAGSDHTCALLADGTVQCWGGNGYGQLGDGTLETHMAPAPVRSLQGVTQIAASWHVTCARLADGRAQCWGRNDMNDVGPWWRCTDFSVDGYHVCKSPRDVPNVGAVTRIGGSGCAFTERDGLVCWSAGLGPPQLARDALPTGLALLSPVEDSNDIFAPRDRVRPVDDFGTVRLFEKAWDNHCAVDAQNAVRCIRLPSGAFGRIHDSSPIGPTVIDVPLDPPTSQLAVSKNHACALATDGSIRCWGDNDSGQLGDGTTTSRANAVLVAN